MSLGPVNIAAIEARGAKLEAGQMLARQVLSEDRLEEEYSQAFNPAAVEREQSRYNRFKTIDKRGKAAESEERKIKEVDKKAEEDLARNYQRRNYELPYNRLLALKNALSESSTPEEILEQVINEFEDVTLADEALEYLFKATEGKLREAVRLAKETLRKEEEQRIVSGQNVDSVAKQFNKKGLGKNPTELRQLYRDITGNPREHNVLFSELASRYSFERLRIVLAFLLKALGYDLKSKGPSIDPAELIRLLTDCRNLQSILWVYLFFKQRMKAIKRQHERKGLKQSESLTFEILAKEFIRLVEERYPSVLKVLRQTETLNLEDPAKIIILSQWRDAIRQLSPRIYKSLKHRQDLLLVILEALEELEEEEESEEE